MVWGMTLPDSFGEFWPEGDFEYDPKKKDTGWYDRLRLHYLAQTPDEQIRLFDYRSLDDGDNSVGHGAGKYPFYVSGKFTHGIGARDGIDSLPFSAAEAPEAPMTFDTEKTYASLGSLIKLNDRILAVDETLKAMIEQLEPDVHQFFPIEIKMPTSKAYSNKYYTLVIGRYCDSFSPEKSKSDSYISYPNYPDFYNIEESKKGVTGIALSKAKFGQAHLWQERSFRQTLRCFSDELMSQISEAGLLIPRHYKMKEV